MGRAEDPAWVPPRATQPPRPGGWRSRTRGTGSLGGRAQGSGPMARGPLCTSAPLTASPPHARGHQASCQLITGGQGSLDEALHSSQPPGTPSRAEKGKKGLRVGIYQPSH